MNIYLEKCKALILTYGVEKGNYRFENQHQMQIYS